MNIAIAGYGSEGKASFAYWRALGHEVTIVDEKPVSDAPVGAPLLVGPEVWQQLGEFDLVIRTASLRPDKINSARKVWSATNEFFAKCPAPILGVTGTKGKGTTSSLITAILRAGGYTVHLVGNIGTPALEQLPSIKSDDLVVFELSSFQLWDLNRSPHIAVVLMIEPDHQDVHTDMNEYLAAKANIRRFQTRDDECYFHPHNQLSRQVAEVSGVALARRYAISDDGACYVNNGQFFVGDRALCPVATLQLVGQHNVENACAAISATQRYVQNGAVVAAGLASFEGLPHRTKLIREHDGVRYYDDNYSSAPGATIAALRSFTEPEIHIMGGYDKHIDFDELAQAIAAQANIKKIILIGQTRHKIAAALDALDQRDRYEVNDETTLKPIVERARALAVPGDVVIMSPGCASFDMFKNFADRGDQFIALVEAL